MSNTRIEQLKEILEMDPKNILTRYALGMEYSGAGQTNDATATFKELLSINPDYANAYFMGAQALQAAERTDDAAGRPPLATKQLRQRGMVDGEMARERAQRIARVRRLPPRQLVLQHAPKRHASDRSGRHAEVQGRSGETGANPVSRPIA